MSLVIDDKLRAVKCNNCGHVRFPFREFCNKCQSTDVLEFPVGPKGKLMSYTISNSRPFIGRIKPPYAYGVARFPTEKGESIDIFGLVKTETSLDEIKIDGDVKVAPDKVYVAFKMVGDA